MVALTNPDTKLAWHAARDARTRMVRRVALLFALCAACKGAPSGRGGGPNPMVEPVASAWCQHHLSCGRVAASKRFESLDVCMVKTRERVAKDLHNCPAVESRVRACVAAISEKTCDAFRVTTPEACDALCND